MTGTKEKEITEFEAIIKTVVKDPALAEQLMKAVVSHYGGQQVYIPKRMVDKTRDADIFADFTGNNLRELCRKYDLSAQHVYKIIRQERIKRQLDLFH